ncbi:hypothetical protein BGW38_005438 [Lunasporangiospora selenospora]|uniref:Uncharacterized protein n=1 Tax=Lunasporangiospora selenospora TaxID=979761 RepID=A0A9P6FNT7_9FUNG|nr:hypothetical protein BGW38_005438 [Lunasporangiospora selenospora]
MPEFAENFKFSRKEDADQMFSVLISKSFIRRATRHTLQSNYNVWQRNEGDQFWAAMEATTQVATDLVVGSVPKARTIILGDNHPSLPKSSTPANERSAATNRPPRKRDRESIEGSLPERLYGRKRPIENGENDGEDGGDDHAQFELDGGGAMRTDHYAARSQDESSNSAHSDDSLDLDETDELVAMITSVKHKDCNLWVLDNRCLTCMTDKYKEASIRALRAKELKKSEPADIMMLAGTFTPWHPTPMMEMVFSKKILKKIRDSLSKKMEPIDNQDADMSILQSIRHRANNKIEEAIEALNGVKDPKLRRLFQQMVEELPTREQGEMSEETLIANHVSPILRAFAHDPDLEIFAHFPNTNSRAQTQQGVKPDRPDFKVVAGNKEVAFGEVTGPCQRNDRKKNGWDLYRLSRFGTAVLNQGAEVVPLVQVVADSGTIYRHIVKDRGVMVLAEVGVFLVPTTTIHMGALLASLPTLVWFRDCIKWLDDHSESLKRSWTAADLAQLRKYVR